MARSIRQFISVLKTELRDTAGSQNIWTFDEYYLGVQSAFRKAKGYFAVPDVYTSLVLTPGLRVAPLPDYVTNVRAVEYAIQQVATSVGTNWNQLLSYRHVQSQETNYLFVDHDFPNSPARVYYDRPLTVPPVEATAATLVSSTASFIPISLLGSSVVPVGTTGYPVQLWAPLVPFHVQIDDEVIRVNSVTITGFAEVYRGAFQTSPVVNSLQYGIGYQHDTPGAITPYIEYDHADDFLLAQAKRELYFYRMNDAPSEENRNISLLAGQFQQEADKIRQEYNPRRTPRTFTSRPPRRY